MTKAQFIQLHSDLRIQIDKTIIVNPLPSATDPTQDVPIKMIEVTAAGVPINVKQYKEVFSNLKVEDFTTIEQRNNDKFDQLGELQHLAGQMKGKKDITTNFTPNKKQKKHEI